MDDLPHNHVTVDHIVDDLRLKLHGVLVADDNARTLATHWQGVATEQRKEIERLRRERDEAKALFETVLEIWVQFVAEWLNTLERAV